MSDEFKLSCARPTGGPVGESVETSEKKDNLFKKEPPMIKVGQKAPDFIASAYHKGKFINLKLSDYSGKWVILCFYPGDFTFV